MKYQETKLEWNKFSEKTWSDFRTLLQEGQKLWKGADETSKEDLDISRYLQWTVPVLMNMMKENDQVQDMFEKMTAQEKFSLLSKIQEKKQKSTAQLLNDICVDEVQELYAQYVLDSSLS